LKEPGDLFGGTSDPPPLPFFSFLNRPVYDRKCLKFEGRLAQVINRT
jgi:hypothetical protein